MKKIKEEIKKYLEAFHFNKNENITIQNLEMQQQQFQEGRLQWYNLTSGNKKNLKPTTLPYT